MDCLREEPVENLLQIPCGVVQVLFCILYCKIEVEEFEYVGIVCSMSWI